MGRYGARARAGQRRPTVLLISFILFILVYKCGERAFNTVGVRTSGSINFRVKTLLVPLTIYTCIQRERERVYKVKSDDGKVFAAGPLAKR